MPVTAGGSEQLPQATPGILPDIHPDSLPVDHRVTIAMEIPNNSPAWYTNWDEMTPEEQDTIIKRYRYMGTRLRSDIKNETVPIARERMELP